jgi:hypothetical protein
MAASCGDASGCAHNGYVDPADPSVNLYMYTLIYFFLLVGIASTIALKYTRAWFLPICGIQPSFPSAAMILYQA